MIGATNLIPELEKETQELQNCEVGHMNRTLLSRSSRKVDKGCVLHCGCGYLHCGCFNRIVGASWKRRRHGWREHGKTWITAATLVSVSERLEYKYCSGYFLEISYFATSFHTTDDLPAWSQVNSSTWWRSHRLCALRMTIALTSPVYFG